MNKSKKNHYLRLEPFNSYIDNSLMTGSINKEMKVGRVVGEMMIKSFLLNLTILVVSMASDGFAQTWVIESIDTSDDCQYSSIALDENGHPHVSYSAGMIRDLRYAHWTGTDWVIEIIDAGNDTRYTSLVLDNSGFPHIGYITTNLELKYARWTGEDWLIEFVDTAHTYWGAASIELDGNDYLHIATNDVFETSSVEYFFWTGSNWQKDIIDSVDIWESTSLALDNNDLPHIAYVNNHWDLKYAHWTGSSWLIQEVDTIGDCEDPSLILDNSNYPHISYNKVFPYQLRYAHLTAIDWIVQRVDTAGGYSSIVLDNNGHPHISYYDPINDDLKYARWTGDNWMIEQVDTAGNVGGWTSIALDTNDCPHISYSMVSPYRWLKHAYYESGNVKEQRLDPVLSALWASANPARNRVIINYRLSTAASAILTIYDAAGRTVQNFLTKQQLKGNYKIKWECSDYYGRKMSDGVYFCELKVFTGNLHIERKIVKLVVLNQ